MGQTHIRIDERLHEKMKSIVTEKGGNLLIQAEYELAVKNHIANFYEGKVLNDSKLEKILDEKLSKIDKHLASMLGRTGMDASMILMGLIYFLENHFNEERKNIFDVLKKDGAKYYTNKE